MSLQVTDATHVALFDSVTFAPIPHAPIFASAEHAEDFAAWAHGEGHDLRRMNAKGMGRLHRFWQDVRLDDDGYLLT